MRTDFSLDNLLGGGNRLTATKALVAAGYRLYQTNRGRVWSVAWEDVLSWDGSGVEPIKVLMVPSTLLLATDVILLSQADGGYTVVNGERISYR